MKTLETSQGKIEKICAALRKETIEPAKQEAAKIIEDAKKQAEQILHDARHEAKLIKARTAAEIEQERKVLHSSLLQASKQSMESLRQDIEQKLFNSQLETFLDKELINPQVVAALINAVVKGIENQGLDADLEAIIAKEVSPKEVSELLLKEVLNRLKEKAVTVGAFKGGAQIRVVNKKMYIDISEVALKELVGSFIRKDFRNLIFNV
ncbi:V-type proton ATPase subunit E [Chlamydiales bacterium STE3]|nr:V-type proton ATPase subunit E [Chlamydiales bacterium STE3]